MRRRDEIRKAAIEADRIRWALRNLDCRELIVFALKAYAGLRLRTIAEILQVSQTTVTAALCRATRNLRHAWRSPGKRAINNVSSPPGVGGRMSIRNSAGKAQCATLKRRWFSCFTTGLLAMEPSSVIMLMVAQSTRHGSSMTFERY